MKPSKKASVKSIGLDSREQQKVLLKRLPKPITTMRTHGNRFLQDLLRAFFSETDDILFDLAKNAVKQQDQDDYFAAMRQLRSHQNKISEAFIDGLDSAYSALSKPSSNDSDITGVSTPLSADDLTLIGHDDMEELIAKESLASRTFSANSRVLSELAMRVNSIVLADVNDRNLPVSPGRLCDLFVSSVHSIQISSKATLVLFKVFESKLLNQLGKLYLEQNRILKERGILPQIEEKRPRFNSPTRQQPETGGLDNPIDPDITALLNQALEAAQPIGDIRPTNGPSNFHQNTPIAASPATASVLDRIANSAYSLQGQNQDGSPARLQLSQLIARAARQMGNQHQPNPQEQSVIQVVDSIFSHLRSPYSANGPIDDLVARLQLLTGRIALKDDQFLEDAEHSGRTLINSLAEAIFRCDIDDESRPDSDPLYGVIQTILRQLNELSNPKTDDFINLLEVLNQYQRSEEKRALALEKRLISAERGRLQNEKARALVQQTLVRYGATAPLPKAIHNIIHRGWQHVMLYIALKYGEESVTWEDSVKVLRTLVSSVRRDVIHKDPARFLRVSSSLRKSIKKGLRLVHFDIFKAEQLLEDMDETFEALLADKSPPVMSAATQAANDADSNNGDLVDKQKVEEIFMRQARGLCKGSWFNLKQGEDYIRCRLAAVFDEYSRYIFVNRLGGKICDLHFQQVAMMLQEQNLVPMDSNQIFEKALEDVISNIKQSR